eukprot:5377389-Amphidinium_carterae.2
MDVHVFPLSYLCQLASTFIFEHGGVMVHIHFGPDPMHCALAVDAEDEWLESVERAKAHMHHDLPGAPLTAGAQMGVKLLFSHMPPNKAEHITIYGWSHALCRVTQSWQCPFHQGPSCGTLNASWCRPTTSSAKYCDSLGVLP